MVEIQQGMYILPQAGILVTRKIRHYLSIFGYIQVKHTYSLFRHKTHKLSFTLVIDDFGVKCSVHADLDHLNNSIQNKIHNNKRYHYQTLLWPRPEMGLSTVICLYFHSMICRQGPETIPPSSIILEQSIPPYTSALGQLAQCRRSQWKHVS